MRDEMDVELPWPLCTTQPGRGDAVACHLVGCTAMQRTGSPASADVVPHHGDVAATSAANREARSAAGILHHRLQRLEGVTSIVAGLIASSVSLGRFGLDSLTEVTSGAALWRLHPT
jgi:hypothetical protein